MIIRGHSDDCFCITDCENEDELSAYDRRRSILIGTVKGGLVVRGEYAPKTRAPKNGIGDGGTWQFAIDLVDEGVPIPWEVRIEMEGYSPHVVIDCPADTPWRELKNDNKKTGADADCG